MRPVYMDIVVYTPQGLSPDIKPVKSIGLYIEGGPSFSKIRWIIGPWTSRTTYIGNTWFQLMDVPWKSKKE